MSDASTPVKVTVRVRPLSEAEKAGGRAVRVTGAGELVTVVKVEGGRKVDEQRWGFDAVHGEGGGQGEVFEGAGVGELCDMAVRGYSATVMAYGQTGCGKTHTMLGPPGSLTGIIPTAANYIFTAIDPTSTTVEASFLEIYNESIYDLLVCGNGSKEAAPLQVRYLPQSNSFFAENALVVRCDSHDDLQAVISEGAANRATASHLLNSDSSRSHAVLTLYFRTKYPNSSPALGKLNFVDLAGSERLKDSGSTGGTVIESCHINKSLLALGQVITSLAGGQNQSYVPYRDSKLTKLLMDSLGGSCKTAMIACVSPSSACIDETLNTLKYAARARCIVTAPAVRTSSKEANIRDMQTRIYELQNENDALRAASTPEPPSRSMSGTGSIAARRDEDELIARLQMENERLRAENLQLKSAKYAKHGLEVVKQEERKPGVLQFAKPKQIVLQDFSEASSVSTPQYQDEASKDAIIHELKTVLARVTMEADALSRGDRCSPGNGISGVVQENLRLAEVLSYYDILKHAHEPPRHGSNAGKPPKPTSRASSASEHPTEDTHSYIKSLEARVQELQAEVESLTMAPEPDHRQHILERRELRLQRETNSMLRLELAKLRS